MVEPTSEWKLLTGAQAMNSSHRVLFYGFAFIGMLCFVIAQALNGGLIFLGTGVFAFLVSVGALYQSIVVHRLKTVYLKLEEVDRKLEVSSHAQTQSKQRLVRR